jgi:hypothetical protein
MPLRLLGGQFSPLLSTAGPVGPRLKRLVAHTGQKNVHRFHCYQRGSRQTELRASLRSSTFTWTNHTAAAGQWPAGPPAPTRYLPGFVTRQIPRCVHYGCSYFVPATRKRRPQSRPSRTENYSRIDLTPKTENHTYLPPAVAPAAAGIIPAIFIPSIRARTFSTLAPVSVHASTYGCRLPSACITSTLASACTFFDM